MALPNVNDSGAFLGLKESQRLQRFYRGSTIHPGDIEGASPSVLHSWHSGHLPHATFIADIEGTSSRAVLLQTGRLVDPLSPAYSLPLVAQPHFPELPFKRDLYSVRDIEGAYPRRDADRCRANDLEVGEAGWGARVSCLFVCCSREGG